MIEPISYVLATVMDTDLAGRSGPTPARGGKQGASTRDGPMRRVLRWPLVSIQAMIVQKFVECKCSHEIAVLRSCGEGTGPRCDCPGQESEAGKV